MNIFATEKCQNVYLDKEVAGVTLQIEINANNRKFTFTPFVCIVLLWHTHQIKLTESHAWNKSNCITALPFIYQRLCCVCIYWIEIWFNQEILFGNLHTYNFRESMGRTTGKIENLKYCFWNFHWITWRSIGKFLKCIGHEALIVNLNKNNFTSRCWCLILQLLPHWI